VGNVLDYGAAGNLSPSTLAGSTDDSDAIQAAIDALGGTNRTLYFPRTPGDSRGDKPLNFTNAQGITILGPYGSRPASSWYVNGNPAGGAIVYTGGFASRSDTRFVDLRDSHAVKVEGMIIRTWASSTLARMVDFEATGAPALGDKPTYGATLTGCFLDTNGGLGAGPTMLHLQGAVTALVDNCQFGAGWAAAAISGARTTGGVKNWSNAVTIRDTMVYPMPTVAAIHNPGMHWSLRGVVFEPPPSGAVAVLHDRGGGFGEAVSFDGCGFWDLSGSAWVKSTGGGRGWSFTGCLFDHGTTTQNIFDLTGMNGFSVTGSRFMAQAGGTPNIFKPGQNITNGNFAGNFMGGGSVDNHASVFV